MDLDNLENIKQLDSENMIGHINHLPEQLSGAWHLGQSLDLPQFPEFSQIVIAGMGGSAIGGDLLSAYASQFSSTPITVLRDYTLPKWKNTLVICSSHSGNTEETLSVFSQAHDAGLPIIALSTGGQLAQLARKTNTPVWTFEDDFQPRAAVGFSFGMLLAALTKLGLFEQDIVEAEVNAAVHAMKQQQTGLLPEVKTALNPAKRMAGQFYNRWITIFGSGFLAPVARRWKTQINEVAKAQAAFEVLPEADHNTLQGLMYPEEQFGRSMAFFLTSQHNHPRNQFREEFTRMAMMQEGIATDFLAVSGASVLEDMWTALHFGDYISYYLAVAYQVDPTPVPMLVELKQALANES